jgi:hypothetical protein
LRDSELGGPVDAREQVVLSLGGLHLGNIDMEDADGVALEVVAFGLVALAIGQSSDTVRLQPPVQPPRVSGAGWMAAGPRGMRPAAAAFSALDGIARRGYSGPVLRFFPV